MTSTQVRYLVQRLTQEGKIVEVGWVSYRELVIPKTAGETQLKESRRAFFAGAHHLFSSIAAGMDEDSDPTEADVLRMEKIHEELVAFFDEIVVPPGAPKA